MVGVLNASDAGKLYAFSQCAKHFNPGPIFSDIADRSLRGHRKTIFWPSEENTDAGRRAIIGVFQGLGYGAELENPPNPGTRIAIVLTW